MKKAAVIVLLSLLAFPAFCQIQDLAPPEWIWGKWYMRFDDELLELIFSEDDILMNGESMRAMIDSEYIVNYQQAEDNEAFSMRVQYADGFWWLERFPRPTMTTEYTDSTYQSGDGEELFYVKGEGLSPRAQGERDVQMPPGPGSAPGTGQNKGSAPAKPVKPDESEPITPNSTIQ
jgi:hypothetical protein